MVADLAGVGRLDDHHLGRERPLRGPPGRADAVRSPAWRAPPRGDGIDDRFERRGHGSGMARAWRDRGRGSAPGWRAGSRVATSDRPRLGSAGDGRRRRCRRPSPWAVDAPRRPSCAVAERGRRAPSRMAAGSAGSTHGPAARTAAGASTNVGPGRPLDVARRPGPSPGRGYHERPAGAGPRRCGTDRDGRVRPWRRGPWPARLSGSARGTS